MKTYSVLVRAIRHVTADLIIAAEDEEEARKKALDLFDTPGTDLDESALNDIQVEHLAAVE